MPTFAEEMLDKAKAAYSALMDHELAAVATGGTSTTFDKKAELRKEIEVWERRVAQQQGKVPRVKRINLGGTR